MQWPQGVGLRLPALLERSSELAVCSYPAVGVRIGTQGCHKCFRMEKRMAETDSASRQQRPNPNEKLVRVFDTEQESEAMVVRGLLESAGIDCDITALDAPQDILPGVGGTVILVREEDV